MSLSPFISFQSRFVTCLLTFPRIYIYITRLASNKIFSPSNKIHREIGRGKDLSAPLYFTIHLSAEIFIKGEKSVLCLNCSRCLYLRLTAGHSISTVAVFHTHIFFSGTEKKWNLEATGGIVQKANIRITSKT